MVDREVKALRIRANFLPPREWAKLWAALAKRKGIPCYEGDELATWDWWLGEVSGVGLVCKEAMLDLVDLSREGGPNSEHPAGYLEFLTLMLDPRWGTPRGAFVHAEFVRLWEKYMIVYRL